uniref:Alkaline ceramidase n=1 Tax=Henneguya salminicola TaxID=69463 RepID=A0A6G3MIK5_HENSL
MRIPSIEVYGDPSANFPGYWGSISSLIDWCEENYINNYYIAEYWNTISNIAYMILFLNIYNFRNRDIHSIIYLISIFCISTNLKFSSINRFGSISCHPKI